MSKILVFSHARNEISLILAFFALVGSLAPASAEIVTGSFQGKVTFTHGLEPDIPVSAKIGDAVTVRFKYVDAELRRDEIGTPGFAIYAPNAENTESHIEVEINGQLWATGSEMVFSVANDNPRQGDYFGGMALGGFNDLFPGRLSTNYPAEELFFVLTNKKKQLENLVHSNDLPVRRSDLSFDEIQTYGCCAAGGITSRDIGKYWTISFDMDVETFDLASRPRAVTPNRTNGDFLDDIETPPSKARQRLGTKYRPFLVRPEGPLSSGAFDVLDAKWESALAGGNSSACEISTWRAARNAARSRFVAVGLSNLSRALFEGSVSAGLAPFNFPSKILISESLLFGIGLVNDHAYGLLQPEDISTEAAKTLTRMTIGYMAPILTSEYVSGDFAQSVANDILTSVSANLLVLAIENEHIVHFAAEGRTDGNGGFPAISARIGLVYNEDTHFVTLFLRSGSGECSSDMLYVLRYEVDGNGLPIESGEIEHEILLLR